MYTVFVTDMKILLKCSDHRRMHIYKKYTIVKYDVKEK